MIEPKILKNEICKILDQKKASNIVSIDLTEKTIIADYFVICSAQSTTQVRALAYAVEEILSKEGVKGELIEPLRKEGLQEGKWSVIDYGSIILHVFLEDIREEFKLDELWSDKNIKEENKTI